MKASKFTWNGESDPGESSQENAAVILIKGTRADKREVKVFLANNGNG